MPKLKEGYYVEHNGDCWQSVFPEGESQLSQLHTSIDEAISYMVGQCGWQPITVLPRKD